MIYNKNKPISLYCRWLGIYMLCVILGAMGLGSIGSLLKILGFVPVVIWIFEKHAFYKNKVIYFAILFVLWSSASLFWSINLSASVSRAVTQVSFLVMLLSAAGYSYSGEEITYLKNCLVWSSRLTAVVVLLTGTHSAGRLLLSGTINENPNYLCAYFLAAVVNGGIIILQKRSSLILKILSVVEIAVYIYITFATGSRGGLLSVVIAGIIVILLYKDNGGSQGLSILKKVGITILVMIVFGIVLSYMPVEISSRFTSEALQNSNHGSGRYILWEDSLNAFGESGIVRQLIGYGAETSRNITYLYDFRIHNVIHNIFIEYLLELGLIGLGLYVLHIASFVIASIKKREIFCLAILSGMIILSISSSIYAFKPYWNIMFFILCVVRGCKKLE